jgi:ketosteroid isomerase-like protein
MRTAVIVLISALALGASAARAAQRMVAVNSNNVPVSTISPDTLTAAQKEIVAADAAWGRAYQTCDMKLMDAVLHDDLIYIHAHARVDTKPVVMKMFGTCANQETTIEPLRVVVLGPDTGIIEAAMKLQQKGLSTPVQSLFTRVYVRQGGTWRLIAHQTTSNPGVDAEGKPMPNPALQPRNAAPPAAAR